MRIAELSRRVEIAPDRLRAWERRYGLLTPRRTNGNARLYSSLDEARVRLMKRYLEIGIRAAEAAELTLAAPIAMPQGTIRQIPAAEVVRAMAAIRAALDRFDETAAHLAFQSVAGAHSMLSVIRDLVIPYMHDIGERWDAAHVTVAQEHFASNFFLARLLPMARGWDHGLGPRALLACPAGEQHVIGLIAFGVALHSCGWRIAYLGADTPTSVMVDAAEELSPDQVVLAISNSNRMPADALREQLATRWPLALAGPGVTEEQSARANATHLGSDPVTAARMVVGDEPALATG